MGDHNDDDRCPATRISRREFVKIGGATLSGTIAGSLLPAIAAEPAAQKEAGYPVVSIGTVSALRPSEPIAFLYPDESSPAVLLRFPGAVNGGVGPANSIVAFSTLCTHKGCPVAYRPERKLLICPCHWSSFDPSKEGQMVIGQGSQALARIVLEVDGDNIRAVGVDGLIYGRQANVL